MKSHVALRSKYLSTISGSHTRPYPPYVELRSKRHVRHRSTAQIFTIAFKIIASFDESMKPLSTTNNKQQFLRKLEKDPKNFSFLSISTFLLMGLLDHLWDDTVAGPRPENGLGKLRKHHTFSFRPSSDQSEAGSARSYGEDSPEETVKVTRSIMIIKPPGYQSGSAPASPAGSTPPLSPFSPPLSPFSAGKEPFRFRRRSTSDAFDKAAVGGGGGSETGPRSSPPPYGM
ncbi:hypothetical protein CARUB_v10020890mg [Capsella rubella]|uniref:Uncharacterized protein n=1 Tax=Capsella rubella TaxID=81985 RepID=R0GIW0_9BRAS|nr:hypothetical protein CARUB_v10020890mg [Capsella rubella]